MMVMIISIIISWFIRIPITMWRIPSIITPGIIPPPPMVTSIKRVIIRIPIRIMI
jgi:hypothetical protein